MKRLLLLGVLAAGPSYASGCDVNAVELRSTGDRVSRFSVEVADDVETRTKGLMFRPSMPSSAGMLFVYQRPQHAVFWMKNTLIPLDMIFADATGRVTRVHAGAVPHDETAIDGGEGVLFVLEINGGMAAKLGIKPGTVLRHPALDQSVAAWACDAG